MSAKSQVITIANQLVGVYWREGQTCQCANFVRYLFEKAGVDIGMAKRPTDYNLLDGAPVGASYADSFAGDDVGNKIARKDVQAGDIVMFRNTYGTFKSGVITHVGIMVDSNSFVHRPTASKPVEKASLANWDDCLAEIRRPLAFYGEGKAKLFIHDKKTSATVEGFTGDGVFKAFCHDNKAQGIAHILGKDARTYKKINIKYRAIEDGKLISYEVFAVDGSLKLYRSSKEVKKFDSFEMLLLCTQKEGLEKAEMKINGLEVDCDLFALTCLFTN